MTKILLNYSRSELRGFCVLAILIGIVLTCRIRLRRNTGELSFRVKEYIEEPAQTTSPPQERILIKSGSITSSPELSRSLDPNTAAYGELILAGLTPLTASNLIKYREKGGHFRSVEDLQRIYGMDSLLYQRVSENFIIRQVESLPGQMEPQDAGRYTELNGANANDLAELPGIGEVLSKRIIRFRDLLGGFYSVSQLVEVYGISDSLQNALQTCIIVDTSALRKIDINQATLEQLQKHPYLTGFEARSILEYRRLKGHINQSNELIDNYLISKENYRKIRPYLAADIR